MNWRNWNALLMLLTLSLAMQPMTATAGQSLTSSSVHRTHAATERVNDLWCFECDTMDHGETCVDVLNKSTTAFVKKCKGEEFICMVKRFSYTTSTENSTSSPKMWSLDRRCSINCEPGCIIIGERTKLYACTSCCEKSLCNTGRGGAASFSLPFPFGKHQHRFAATGIGVALLWLLLHNAIAAAVLVLVLPTTSFCSTLTTTTTTTYQSAKRQLRSLQLTN